jgi:hypothetical protein
LVKSFDLPTGDDDHRISEQMTSCTLAFVFCLCLNLKIFGTLNGFMGFVINQSESQDNIAILQQLVV